MRALTAADLLTVWELGLAQKATERALTLLGAADDTPREELAELSLGARDGKLLELRARTFGSELAALASCPACNETLEFAVSSDDLPAASNSDTPATLELHHGEYDLRFRLPNSADLSALNPDADVESNRRDLLRHCLLHAARADKKIEPDALPPQVVSAIADKMEEADPQADVQIALTCPQCTHRWNSPLDIAAFFWSEVHAAARRLLHDIHTLATAYGWREADILSLSAARRQAYIDLLQQ